MLEATWQLSIVGANFRTLKVIGMVLEYKEGFQAQSEKGIRDFRFIQERDQEFQAQSDKGIDKGFQAQ